MPDLVLRTDSSSPVPCVLWGRLQRMMLLHLHLKELIADTKLTLECVHGTMCRRVDKTPGDSARSLGDDVANVVVIAVTSIVA